MVERLVGQAVPVADYVRVGRYNPDRPRPVILRFNRLEEKVAVLRAKSVVHTTAWPADLQGIQVYHNLSAAQLEWKRRLRGAYEYYLGVGVRVVWRRGYQLFALLDGRWTEFYSASVLTH